MSLTHDEIAGLNVALNEATVLSVDYDVVRHRAAIGLELLSLRESSPAEVKRQVELRLTEVSRVVVSLSENGTNRQIRLQDISDIVASFRGQPIYGWEFIDSANSTVSGSLKQPMLDYRTGVGVATHVLHLFQDDQSRRLDILISFDQLQFVAIDGQDISITEIIAAGKRWWDGVFAADPKTRGHGIEPLD